MLHLLVVQTTPPPTYTVA